MNTDTGELRRMAYFLSEDQAKALGFTKVPKEYEAEAEEIMRKQEAEAREELERIAKETEAVKTPVYADMTADTPLVNWARAQQRKKKSRAKMAKASKRRNRTR